MCVLFKCNVSYILPGLWIRNKMRIKKGPGMAVQAEDAPTGLCVIWHTVKDRRNLHSNCVPVGRLSCAWALLCCYWLLSQCWPQHCSGSWRGGGSGQWVHCGRLPSLSLLNIQQHTYTLTCLPTQWRAQSSPPPFRLKALQSGVCLKFRERTTSIFIPYEH